MNKAEFFLVLSKYKTLIVLGKKKERERDSEKEYILKISQHYRKKKVRQFYNIKIKKCSFLTIAVTRLMCNLSLTGKQRKALKSQHM